jgi:anti-anti-sigma factor
MDIKIIDDIVILTPKGLLLGGKETDELEARIKELDSAGNEKLLIDLSQTTFMSSMGMACLFLAHAKYIKRGARVKLCSVDRKIKALFALVKLTLIYGDDLHDSEDEALASFRRILSKAEAHSSAG